MADNQDETATTNRILLAALAAILERDEKIAALEKRIAELEKAVKDGGGE